MLAKFMGFRIEILYCIWFICVLEEEIWLSFRIREADIFGPADYEVFTNCEFLVKK